MKLLLYLIANYDEQGSYDPTTSTDRTLRRSKILLKPYSLVILIPTIFVTKMLQKAKIIQIVVQFQRMRPYRKLPYKNIKGRRGLKGPRRPAEPSDLLDFEEAARLRQQTKILSFLGKRPVCEM